MLIQIKRLIFKTGLGSVLDKARFYCFKIFNRKKNKEFRKSHPTYIVPPDHFLYETYRLDYKAYFENIHLIAREIVQITSPYMDYKKPGLSILDWGCGVGGNIKGIKEIVASSAHLFGCDVNCQMIEWNKNNLPAIDFSCINSLPPTNYSNWNFDLIFGISIFTHLSRESHFLWINELHRILNKNGILLLTTHGSFYKNKLSLGELKKFDAGEIVERNNAKEGLRIYTTFHPPIFIQKLIQDKFEILAFYDGLEFPELIGSQDKWLLRKITQF
jgi:SAM-dependent methyltransferase